MPMLKFKPGSTLAALLIGSTLTLYGCMKTMGGSGPDVPLVAAPPVVDRVCADFGPLTWSDHDTDQTILQVKHHNAVWKSICQPPAATPH